MTAVELPPRVQSKLVAFEDAADEAQTLANGTMRRISELQKALDLNPEGENAANFEHEISRLRAVLGQHQMRHAERLQLVTQLRTWLGSLHPKTVLKAAPASKIKPAKGESLPSAIHRVRIDIATVRSEIQTVHRAMPRLQDIKANIRKRVEDLAKANKPTMTITHDGFDFRFESGGFTLKPNMTGVLAWLDAESLIRRLEQEVEAMPTPELALSRVQKAKRLAKLSEQLDQLERDEEALVEATLDVGQAMTRRPDASPAAILGVVVVKSAAIAA